MNNKTIYKSIAFLLLFIPISVWGAIGDTFEYTAPEGVNLTFKIKSEVGKTVQFGTGRSTYSSIDKSFSGSITIPSEVNGYHVVEIASYAFYNCKKITNINLPNDISSIGSYAFSGCSNLQEFYVPEGITEIEQYTFENCVKLSFVYLPDGITKIGSHAFDRCSVLASIDFPESLEKILSYAFYKCNGLGSISIPSNTTSIGKYAFYGCKDLQEVTIGKNVATIGEHCFYGCTNLTKYYCLGTSPASVSTFAFSNTSSAILYIPQNSINAYKNAEQWKKFKNIVGVDNTADGINNSRVNKSVLGYFTLEGRPVETPQKGIFIMKFKDGRTKKVRM